MIFPYLRHLSDGSAFVDAEFFLVMSAVEGSVPAAGVSELVRDSTGWLRDVWRVEMHSHIEQDRASRT